jgi:methylenetetrahydrofolate dehydrogenase (NADP+)/methenyltetrahydrofolate cyclohydrolase
MTAKIISGTEIAKQIREELKKEVADLKAKHNLVPGLATVLVGEDPASKVYVGQKEKACNELGITLKGGYSCNYHGRTTPGFD